MRSTILVLFLWILVLVHAKQTQYVAIASEDTSIHLALAGTGSPLITTQISNHTIPIVWADPIDACSPLWNGSSTPHDIPGTHPFIVMAQRGQCTFSQKSAMITNTNAMGGIIVNTNATIITMAVDTSIPFVMVSNTSSSALSNTSARMWRVPNTLIGMDSSSSFIHSFLDPALLLIFAMAIVIAGGAAWLCGNAWWLGDLGQWRLYRQWKQRLSLSISDEDGDSLPPPHHVKMSTSPESEDYIPPMTISLQSVVIALIFASGILIALYFLRSYLHEALRIIFLIASTSACFPWVQCLLHRKPNQPISKKLTIMSVCLTFILTLSWYISTASWSPFGDASKFSWIIQDLMCACIVTMILRTFYVDSFRVCTFFLLLALIYDVFFVFITVYLTPSGKSIMVEVATGGSDTSIHPNMASSTMPMVLLFPRPCLFHHLSLPNTANTLMNQAATLWLELLHGMSANQLVQQNACEGSAFSLLGLGDIALPALFATLCRRIDMLWQWHTSNKSEHTQLRWFHTSSSPKYLQAFVRGYTIGLLMTGIALVVTGKGQPALLYLAPCTLISVLSVAYKRQEIDTLWRASFWKTLWCCPSPEQHDSESSDTGLLNDIELSTNS